LSEARPNGRANGRWDDAVDELARVLRAVKEEALRSFEDEILSSKRVFVTGLGRTGLMARGFAMRLMHLGRRV
jgi:6-phospho-3-hexuloisomerase